MTRKGGGPTAPRSEEALVARLKDRLGATYIGDDAAFLPTIERPVVTVDHQIEGVHFPPGVDPDVIGRRLVAVNMSDLAASGAAPLFAWLAIAAPPSFDTAALLDAVADETQRFGCTLAGGDMASATTLITSLTLVGELPEGANALRRDRAEPGDTLWLGGQVGVSALGRRLVTKGPRAEFGDPSLRAFASGALARHLAPTPQLELGAWLARQPRAAALDVSDGLALDLHRLARASAVDATLDLDALLSPERAPREALCESLGLSAIDEALYGGEDYVLLFALPDGVRPPAGLDAFAIGRCLTPVDDGGRIFSEDGNERREISIRGWDHFASDPPSATSP